MRHLLAIAVGLGILLAAAAVCYAAGIFFDRWLHGFMSDEEYERLLVEHGHIEARIGSGLVGLLVVGAVLALMWLLGSPWAGVWPR